MEVRCNRCSKNHTIPDSSVTNRRIYFFCSQCGHKIIVNGENSFAHHHGSPQISEHKPLPAFNNILDAVSFSFNPIIILMSFVFSISAFTLLFFFAVVFFKEISFFPEYRTLSITLIVIVLTAVSYGYSILLYLISKFQMRKSETNETGVNWEFILFDLKDDYKTILFFSVLLPLVFSLLILPVYFLGEYGFTYAAVVSPFIFVLAIAILFSLLLYNLIPSIIASESLSTRESIITVFLFVRRELINIPFYLFTSQIIHLFILCIMFFLFSSAFILTLAGISYAMDPVLQTNAFGSLISLKSVITSGLQFPYGIDSITVECAILLFFIFIILQFLFSFSISLYQSLIAQSCWIMNKNRENSVPKNAILIIMTLFILATLFSIHLASNLWFQSVHF